MCRDASRPARIAPVRQSLRDVRARVSVLLGRRVAHAHTAPTDTGMTLEEIIRSHGRAMYRTAKAIVIDHHLAEDVVQDSLIKVWRNLDTFRGESSFRGWVLAITHNTAVSHLRRIRDSAVDLADVPVSRDEHGAAETRTDISEGLASLDGLSRAIVVLCDVEGLSYAETAGVLGVSEAVVRSRLFRARRRLIEFLGAA